MTVTPQQPDTANATAAPAVADGPAESAASSQWGIAPPRTFASRTWTQVLAGGGLFIAGALVASSLWLLLPATSSPAGGSDARDPDSSGIAAVSTPGSPTPAIDTLLAGTDTFRRDAAAQGLAARSSPAELEALLQSLGGRTGPAADALRSTLLTRLASSDPARALGAIADLQPALAGRTAELVALVFEVWGRRDLNAAIGDWRLLEGVDRELAADALLAVVLERGGDTEAFLRALSPPVPLTRLRIAIARDAALRDPDAAWLQFFRQRDVEGLRTVVRTWARADPPAALAAIDRASSSALRGELRLLLLTTWLRRDPDAALEAVFAEATPDSQTLATMAYTLGSSAGAAGFDTAMESIPPTARDSAIEPFLQGATAQDPEAAWQLSRRVTLPDDARQRIRTAILRQVAATGPNQAIALSNSLSDTTERDALMQMLSEDYVAHDSGVALQFIMEIDDLTLRAALRNALAARNAPVTYRGTGAQGGAGPAPP